MSIRVSGSEANGMVKVNCDPKLMPGRGLAPPSGSRALICERSVCLFLKSPLQMEHGGSNRYV